MACGCFGVTGWIAGAGVAAGAVAAFSLFFPWLRLKTSAADDASRINPPPTHRNILVPLNHRWVMEVHMLGDSSAAEAVEASLPLVNSSSCRRASDLNFSSRSYGTSVARGSAAGSARRQKNSCLVGSPKITSSHGWPLESIVNV